MKQSGSFASVSNKAHMPQDLGCNIMLVIWQPTELGYLRVQKRCKIQWRWIQERIFMRVFLSPTCLMVERLCWLGSRIGVMWTRPKLHLGLAIWHFLVSWASKRMLIQQTGTCWRILWSKKLLITKRPMLLTRLKVTLRFRVPMSKSSTKANNIR